MKYEDLLPGRLRTLLFFLAVVIAGIYPIESHILVPGILTIVCAVAFIIIMSKLDS